MLAVSLQRRDRWRPTVRHVRLRTPPPRPSQCVERLPLLMRTAVRRPDRLPRRHRLQAVLQALHLLLPPGHGLLQPVPRRLVLLPGGPRAIRHLCVRACLRA